MNKPPSPTTGEPSPNLPVHVSAQSVALQMRPPDGGIVTLTQDDRGFPLVAYPKDPALPVGAQLGILTGVAAGWTAGFVILSSVIPPGSWAYWLTRGLLVAWTAGGSVLLARMLRLIRTRGRVSLRLGSRELRAEGTRALRAADDVVTREAASSARLVTEGNSTSLQVDGADGKPLTLARDLPLAEMEWLRDALHAYGRGDR